MGEFRPSRPGERRGGRQKGSVNKATADIRALAQEYTGKAIRALAALAGLLEGREGVAESETARIMALKELIDRGHGKATQVLEGKFEFKNLSDVPDDVLEQWCVEAGVPAPTVGEKLN